MKLAFSFTLTCNAQCAHCITLAGPRVARKMTLAQAQRVIDGVARTPSFDGIVFTGGESFVHRDELLELIRYCTERGLEPEVVSNGFWAPSYAAALDMLVPFKEAGLRTLRISIDKYHLPFVSAQRVHNALQALKRLELARHVTCVVGQPAAGAPRGATSGRDLQSAAASAEGDAEAFLQMLRQGWPPELVDLLTSYGLRLSECVLLDDLCALKSWNDSMAAARLAAQIEQTKILIQYQFVLAEGRGRQLLSEVACEHVDDMPDVVCNSVGYSPTMTPEGEMFPCFSTWTNLPHQAIGRMRDNDVPELMEQIKSDPIALFMHYQGPRVLIQHLRSKGEQLPERYNLVPTRHANADHPCHLCGTLLARYPREELEEHIRGFYKENPWRLLITTRGTFMMPCDVTPFL